MHSSRAASSTCGWAAARGSPVRGSSGRASRICAGGTCRRASREEAVDEVGLRLRRFMPGDSHSDLSWRTQVAWESLAPVLVPVWVLAVRYRDDRPPLRVVINGQTGAIAGKVPLVWWK